MRFVIVALLALAVVATARNLETDLENYSYVDYLTEFQKDFPSMEEMKMREALFQARVAMIQQHNRRGLSWKMSVNKFADRTEEEIRQFRGYSKTMAAALKTNLGTERAPDFFTTVSDLPASVDWRTVKNAVTPVKDQGQCGSCWAFSATASIESAFGIATGGQVILSPQNIVSCTPNPNQCGGTGGCSGATAELAFSYVSQKGVATEIAWPYQAADGTCNENIPKAVKVAGWVQLPSNNYTALLNAIATVGPISVSVDASAWSFYSSGVFDGCSTTDVDIDHAVQLVGYGVDNGTPYWLIRNSWSDAWGENGYIRIRRHDDGSSKWCYKDTHPSDGSGCAGGPSEVTVCGTCGVWYDSSYPTGASKF